MILNCKNYQKYLDNIDVKAYSSELHANCVNRVIPQVTEQRFINFSFIEFCEVIHTTCHKHSQYERIETVLSFDGKSTLFCYRNFSKHIFILPTKLQKEILWNKISGRELVMAGNRSIYPKKRISYLHTQLNLYLIA